jgi:hypothetical protein
VPPNAPPLDREPPNAPPEDEGDELERGGGEYEEPLERAPPKLDPEDDGRDGEEYDREGDDEREPPKLPRRCAKISSAKKKLRISVRQAMKRMTSLLNKSYAAEAKGDSIS